MNPVLAKLAGFAAALALLFGAGALVGGWLDPSPLNKDATARAMPMRSNEGSHGAMADGEAMPVRGLAVAENGLRLVVSNASLERGRKQLLRFRIVHDNGAIVRRFDVEHTKRMHLIVVRRDMAGFQHLHPTQSADGQWTVPLRLNAAGSYRVFADFARQGTPTTLASDLRVPGRADLRPLPRPATSASVDDGRFEVKLGHTTERAGEESTLPFTVLRHGKPVHVEPYLGASGHLVALRDGDMAFLHVHPSARGAGDGIEFASTFPTSGNYRLFLQFKVDGQVHTAALTQAVS